MIYETLPVEDIFRLEPLWKELIEHLKEHTTLHREFFTARRFDTRIYPYLDKVRKGHALIRVVIDETTGKDVGYCFCSIDCENVGELESLYVNPAYRHHGIGDRLMEEALAFFDKHKTTRDLLYVSEGNEGVMDFYRRHEFELRSYVMTRKK